MGRILVTGGSGFIGTNLLSYMLKNGHEVLSIDIVPPQNEEHNGNFREVDVLDANQVDRVVRDFRPQAIIHLAARTDLDERVDISGYRVNTAGVENIVDIISRHRFIERCVFTSSKLVCPTDYVPQSMEDYCPDTLYGQSKVVGEELVKNARNLSCVWSIIRPTSIWGPWSMMPHIPYGRFFRLIARGMYFHIGGTDAMKSFGFVGNTVFQIQKLLDAPDELVHRKVFYISDYDPYSIRDWADRISMKVRNRPALVLPEPCVRLVALIGDMLKAIGIREPPFSTFRLKNMKAETSGIPLSEIKLLTGPLPYSIEEGIDSTILWLRERGYIT